MNMLFGGRGSRMGSAMVVMDRAPLSFYRLSTVTVRHLHCVPKNDTDVTHYRFNPHQPILVIFGRDVAERVCY